VIPTNTTCGNPTFYLHSAFICSIQLSQYTAVMSKNSTGWMIFVMEMQVIL